MKKIVLLCASGMSTNMFVKKMKEAAKALEYECTISAFSTAEAETEAADADIILLGPQVRFSKSRVEAQCPGRPVEVIDMHAYGRMDGRTVMERAIKLLG